MRTILPSLPRLIWNYTYRPMNSDDFDIRYPEMVTYAPWNFVTHENRAAPSARVAIYPYRRFFQIGMVDTDLDSGFSTVASMLGSSRRKSRRGHSFV